MWKGSLIVMNSQLAPTLCSESAWRVNQFANVSNLLDVRRCVYGFFHCLQVAKKINYCSCNFNSPVCLSTLSLHVAVMLGSSHRQTAGPSALSNNNKSAQVNKNTCPTTRSTLQCKGHPLSLMCTQVYEQMVLNTHTQTCIIRSEHNSHNFFLLSFFHLIIIPRRKFTWYFRLLLHYS